MVNVLVMLTAIVLLVLQGFLAYVAPSEYIAPILVLPLVLSMAVGDFSLTRGVSLAFATGYLADVFAGASLGLCTFGLVSIFLLVRVAGLKLFLHGVVFQILLTFVASVAMGLEMTALLLVFDRRPLAVRAALGVVAMQGLATALLAPAVFALMRRLPTNLAPAPDET